MSRFPLEPHYPAMMPLVTVARNIRTAGRLEPVLVDLVLMRASQINGCAYCLDMHGKDARAAGETEQRLYVLPAWRETNLFSERERIALAWTEELTELASPQAVPDALYEQARQHFDDAALVDLILLIGVINSFNRLNIAVRTIGGSYTVGEHG
ncbi:carboxymuconolactone decarboxylase family protein [Frateuria sp. YIM B11624]|uniref:carboxymuconolactone decarboxylase family protein n=1 Tax=Frateuria sp. YIM B11624 TaxID=3143185 RepID=UPI003C744AC0